MSTLKAARVAKHVHLRTQQRRLRHLRIIAARNLQLSESFNPLSVNTYFSLHRVTRPDHDSDVVIYKSEIISGSLNPQWAVFNLQDCSPFNAFTIFVIKVWIAKQGRDPDYQLAVERVINLRDLMYIGNLPIRDSPPYVANSLLFGLFEGYYSDIDLGMTSKIPGIRHYLSRYLPPQSVIEVPKTQVHSSYEKEVLLRILRQQNSVRKNEKKPNSVKQKIGCFLETNSTVFSKQKELERLKNSIYILGHELAEQQQRLDKDRQDLVLLENEVKEKEEALNEKRYSLNQEKLLLAAEKTRFCSEKKQLLISNQKKLEMRRNTMINEASSLFPIMEYQKANVDFRTICGVRLPDELEIESIALGNQDQYAVAISYMIQLLQLISKIQQVPLRFTYKFNGSRSYLRDDITKMTQEVHKELPLFVSKRNEKAVFVYATHLINREIVQLCQVCGVEVPKSQVRKNSKMLKNLKNLVDSSGNDKKKLELTSTIRPMPLVLRQTPTILPLSTTHGSSSPSSGPRTASNSFLSTTSTVDDERALTDLHVSSHPGQYISLPVDTLDGDGALQEEVGGAVLENKNSYHEFETSTEVSNYSSSREDLTSASEVEINVDRRERSRHEKDVDLRHTPVKELTYTEGSSLLSPVTYSMSHFSALSGLESVGSPTKTDNTL